MRDYGESSLLLCSIPYASTGSRDCAPHSLVPLFQAKSKSGAGELVGLMEIKKTGATRNWDSDFRRCLGAFCTSICNQCVRCLFTLRCCYPDQRTLFVTGQGNRIVVIYIYIFTCVRSFRYRNMDSMNTSCIDKHGHLNKN